MYSDHRLNGFPSILGKLGWTNVEQIDNDGESGGGFDHDLLNDAFFTTLIGEARSGKFDAIMVGFPCSTFSFARFFDASKGDPSKDRGPLPVRTAEHPDGLPDDQVEAGHLPELRNANRLLKRTFELCLAAKQSPSNATIIIENPASRSIERPPPVSWSHLL